MMRQQWRWGRAMTGLWVAVALAACGSGEGGSAGNTDAGNGSGGTGGGISLGDGGTGGGEQPPPGPYQLPDGFTESEFGGYLLGDAFVGDTPPAIDGGAGGTDGCGSTILGVVRDFKGADEPGGHSDFEHYSGSDPTLGLAQAGLGADLKPVYTGSCEASLIGSCPYGQQTTSKADFDEWYRYAAGVNRPYLVYLSLEPNGDVLTFQSDTFFPLDGAGWGNSHDGEDGLPHNFGFTTEVHTQFKYAGGEHFTFVGDDDVWVFINDRLAVDLGGLHPSATGSVDLDAQASELGIAKGKVYRLDLFHAERHSTASHFRIDTNLEFTNCGTVVPEPPPS